MSWTSGGAGSLEVALWETGEYMHRFRYASRCSDPNLWPLFSDCSIFSLKAEARSWAENEDVCGGVRDLKGEEKVWNSCLGNQQHKWTRIILCDFLATLSAHLRFMVSNLKGECTVFHFFVFFSPSSVQFQGYKKEVRATGNDKLDASKELQIGGEMIWGAIARDWEWCERIGQCYAKITAKGDRIDQRWKLTWFLFV